MTHRHLPMSIFTAHAGSWISAGNGKSPINSASDLPAYSYLLTQRPSRLLAGPIETVLNLADEIVANDARTLAAFDIVDRTSREVIVKHRMEAAMLRGDIKGVKDAAAELRSLQDREDRKLTQGLLDEIVAEACASSDPGAVAQRLARDRVSALPAAAIDAWLKLERSNYATANSDLLIGQATEFYDTIADKNDGQVDQVTASSIITARASIQCRHRVAPQIATVLAEIIEANRGVEESNIWTPRNLTLPENAEASEVVIAVWDSGVDLALFRPAADPGCAIDDRGRPVTNLLRDAKGYDAELPELMELLKGMLDLRAGQLTPEAASFQRTMTSLKPEDAKPFQESLGFAANYVHGTHVAGIAVEGNPFAQVQAISMHFPVRQEDIRLDREISERRAAFYKEAVGRMRKAGVRVANMSWRLSPAIFEAMLAAQGGQAEAAERKRLAGEFFCIERAALEAAFASAPEILFVAGAGNESNDADFSEYIPASISAPNLITVGAVDKAGREAAFTSIGGSVAIYANGVDIDSYVPGGARMSLSGTSMASPQVANAAAKLFAVKPALSGAENRALLMNTADQSGRVRLLNTRAALERAGVGI